MRKNRFLWIAFHFMSVEWENTITSFAPIIACVRPDTEHIFVFGLTNSSLMDSISTKKFNFEPKLFGTTSDEHNCLATNHTII